ncbi:kinase-like protein [Mollisia scopiformis]|uniref:Kinase-like protein n=1 Tax=Mollisia scopiformis TaxID=149040 RepID=A0A132BAX5_MOLSC|nr:kinase-like protein [Mollisia scopiformis]KUJ09423.1 kinase-like protein [Mollisia scopiformis]
MSGFVSQPQSEFMDNSTVLASIGMANTLVPTITRATQPSRFWHSRQLEESYQNVSEDHIENLKGLVRTLQENAVPGPQLFRLRHEFTDRLGTGGESEVYGISSAALKFLRQADKQDHLRWPVEKIAIKQHKPKPAADSVRLSSHFLAAKREVLALAPTLFQKHPNIVQLLGWGFCLDAIEDFACDSFQIPLLILERAETDLYRFVRGDALCSRTTIAQDLEAGSDKWRLRQDDVVRRLCVDVGNGLYALHQQSFAHGDLKPQNVLVFQNGRRLVAKLCDFGCTRGVVEPSGDSSRNTRYAGTPGWLPPEVIIGTDRGIDHAELQKCDIYTYGLLVWSVFCQFGDPPLLQDQETQILPDIVLERGLQDVQETFSGRSRWLAETIIEVLRNTLQLEPTQRSSTPWDQMRTRSENAVLQMQTIWRSFSLDGLTPKQRYAENRASEAAHNESSANLASHKPLTSEDKRLYGTWWGGSQAASTNLDIAASRTVLRDDDNFQSLSTFQAPERQIEIARLYKDLRNTLAENRAEDQRNLYCYARLRSRGRLAWWPQGPDVQNILCNAVVSKPRPEISILAWLCRGEIGTWEVQHLPASAEFWNAAVNSQDFNGSQRLELFLLLLQFGARVETRLSFSPEQARSAVLFEFLQNCRRATIRTVMKEICRRFDEVKDEEQISSSTRYYFTGQPELQSSEANSVVVTTFGADLYAAGDYTDALNVLSCWRFVHATQLRYISQGHGQGRDWYRLPDEIQPLVQLPIGWEQIKELNGVAFRLPCFRDSITASITLRKPKRSLLLMRQIALGFNTPDNQESCYIDIAAFIRPESSRAAKQIVDQGINRRFRSYDDSWFNLEQYGPLPSDDVLKALKDDAEAHLPTFADRIKPLESIFSIIWTFLTSILPSALWIVVVLIMTSLTVMSIRKEEDDEEDDEDHGCDRSGI